METAMMMARSMLKEHSRKQFKAINNEYTIYFHLNFWPKIDRDWIKRKKKKTHENGITNRLLTDNDSYGRFVPKTILGKETIYALQANISMFHL